MGMAQFPTLTIGVAGNIPDRVLRAAHVILHHGRVYPLPEHVQPARTVMQTFPDEDVPHDTRLLGALVGASMADDN